MYDVVVVGAGPAGLTASANAAHRGLKSLVIEKQDIAGGLPVLVYPDKVIRDHPGFPCGIIGKELSRMLFVQAESAGADIHLDEEVLRIVRKEKDLTEVSSSEGTYQSRRVILCTGISNVPKKIEALKHSEASNIQYKVGNTREYKNKRIVIVGGGDYAYDTAIQLAKVAKNIILLVKGKYAKAKDSSVKLADEMGVKALYSNELVKFFKDSQGRISRIHVRDSVTQEKKIISVDVLFVAVGFEPIKSFFENNGFILKKDGSVKVDKNLQTNIKGIFAAGDITGEIRLIATACAEGIVAAIHAFETIKKPYWLR